jgi:hypothetical protein
LEKDFEEGLRAAKMLLATRYGDLDSAAMLQHMHAREAPKRKEIVALVSAAQNFVRVADGALLRTALPDEAAIRNVAHIAIRSGLCPDGSLGEIKKLWGRDVDARSRRLKAILEEYGFAKTTEIELPGLAGAFITNTAALSLADILTALELSPW